MLDRVEITTEIQTNPNGNEKIDIKELEITDKGIRIKYERSRLLLNSLNGGDPRNGFSRFLDNLDENNSERRAVARHKEEAMYPKKGEVSKNYSDRIDRKIESIANACLGICGLTEEVWENEHLKLTKISFYQVENNGRNEISISGKLKSRNELLNTALSFNIPKIPPGAILEYDLRSTVVGLVEDLQDFYNGTVKYEQPSLF